MRAGTRRSLLVWLTIITLVAGCGTAAPSLAPATPLPTQAPGSAVPSIVPSPSPASSLLPTPTPTPGDLFLGQLVVTVSADVRVRSQPWVGTDSIKYEPLLPLGTELRVLDGPVSGSGYVWYKIAPIEFRLDEDRTEGWVAKAGKDGEPWIATVAHPVGFENWRSAGTPIGTMGSLPPRAALLADGRVLEIAITRSGGDDPVAHITAELWDPATGTWRATAHPDEYPDFLATLPDGRVLALSTSEVFVFDPRPGREAWSRAGELGSIRGDAAAALLPDGRLLVAGGHAPFATARAGPSPSAVLAAFRPGAVVSSDVPPADIAPGEFVRAFATAEIFDPATGRSTPTGSLVYARLGAAAVTLADGRVLVVGSGPYLWMTGADPAIGSDERAYDSAEIYDPATGRFSLAGELPAVDSTELRKQGIESFGQGTPWDADANGTLVALADGGALLVGHTRSWHGGMFSRSLRFDVRTGRWSEVGETFASVYFPSSAETPGVSRLNALVARLPDGRVLIAGGESRFVTHSADLYDPATDTWSPLPPMPEARAGGAAVTLRDGSVLLVGGYDLEQQSGEQLALATSVRFVPEP